MKPTLHIDTRSPWWRWGLMGLAAVLVLALIVIYVSSDAPPEDAAATPAEANPYAAPTAAPRRPDFPAIKLTLVQTHAEGEAPHAVIDVAGQPGTFKAGQDIAAGIRLNTVESDHVVLGFAGSTRILWGAVVARADADEDSPTDIRQRNRHIDVARLTSARPRMADTFLREVLVQPNPRGGYTVESVVPGSLYDKMGLRAGDVVYTLDTPQMAAVDENSMIALTMQTEIEMDVHRNGTQIRLRHALNIDEPEPAASGR